MRAAIEVQRSRGELGVSIRAYRFAGDYLDREYWS